MSLPAVPRRGEDPVSKQAPGLFVWLSFTFRLQSRHAPSMRRGAGLPPFPLPAGRRLGVFCIAAGTPSRRKRCRKSPPAHREAAMRMILFALGACSLFGAALSDVGAQTRPSPPKEESAPGAAAGEGTGSNPTRSPQSIDRHRPAMSTKDSNDNKSYGRETGAEGHPMEKGNAP